MRTAFNTVFLESLPVVDAVRVVRATGYDEVELNAEELPWARPHVSPETDAETRRTLRRLGPFSSICAHRNDLAVRDRLVRDMAVKWTIDCARLAVDVGAPLIHVIGGTGLDRIALYDSLERIVARAETLGVRVGIEPIIGHTVATTAQAEDVLDAIPGLGINFDPSHLHVTTKDVVEAARRLGSRTIHVHVKDAIGTVEDYAFVPLGAGGVNFSGLLATLADLGYDGVLSVEHESQLFGDKRGPAEVLASGKSFLDALIGSLREGKSTSCE